MGVGGYLILGDGDGSAQVSTDARYGDPLTASWHVAYRGVDRAGTAGNIAVHLREPLVPFDTSIERSGAAITAMNDRIAELADPALWRDAVVAANQVPHELSVAPAEPEAPVQAARAADPAPAAAPDAEPATAAEPTNADSDGSETVVAGTVSFYYCQPGPNVGAVGDGGGFCGAMADGSPVQPGAAACAPSKLGEQFRIVGDPRGITYTCMDTGSAVHGQHRDIWFNTSDQGSAWYRSVGRNVTLEVLP